MRAALAGRAFLNASLVLETKSKLAAEGVEDPQLVAARERIEDLDAQLTSSRTKVRSTQTQLDEARAKYARLNEEHRLEDVVQILECQEAAVLCGKLEVWLEEQKLARLTCEKIVAMCNKKDSGKTRKQLVTQNAIEQLLTCMNNAPQSITKQEACCSALAALSKHEGATRAAANPAAIPAVVRAIKLLYRGAARALLNIVGTDEALKAKAKEAGAKDEWLITDTTEDPDVVPTPTRK